MSKKNALGKGLGTLSESANVNIGNITRGQGINAMIPLSNRNIEVGIEMSKISVNPLQPRKEFDLARLNELKESIAIHGLLQPINVKEIIGGYEIVSGERRFRAFQLLGKSVIPAIVTSVNSNAEQLEKALIENIQREDLNPIEIANSYQQLIDEFEYTQDQLAQRVGKNRSSVANILRILKLPIPVQDLILQNKLSLGHAKVLLSLEDSSQITSIANDIINKGLSVRATESVVRDILSEKVIISKDGKKKVIPTKLAPILTEEQVIIEDIQNRLRVVYGTNIKIFSKPSNNGTIEIEFYSASDFDRLVELLERPI